MLKPLNPKYLRALAEDDVDTNYLYMNLAKHSFKFQSIDEGVKLLFEHIDQFGGRLHIDSEIVVNGAPRTDEWHISFTDRLFRHLTVRPDPDRKAFVQIYEDERHRKTYEILGHPEQWQAMMIWIWNYGNDRLVRMVAIKARKKVSHNRLEPRIPFSSSSGSSSWKDPAKKHNPDLTLHRPLRSQVFKAHGSKSRGKIGPSNLGLASLTLTDVEEQIGEEQLPHTIDTKGSDIVTPIEVDADGIARLETTNVDVKMAGVASIGV